MWYSGGGYPQPIIFRTPGYAPYCMCDHPIHGGEPCRADLWGNCMICGFCTNNHIIPNNFP